MITDTPQRQSAIGIVILTFDGLYLAVKAFWPFLVYLLVRINEIGLIWILPTFAALLALFGILAWLRHRNYTFWLDPTVREFIVNKGIISKTRVAIPVERIQQVNINQSLLHRIAGVYSLDIDTAGSAAREVSVRAISLPLARHLRDHLLEWRESALDKEASNGSVDATTSASAGTDAGAIHSASAGTDSVTGIGAGATAKSPNSNRPSLLHLDITTLLKIGITTKYGRTLAVITGFFFTVYGSLYDLISTFELDEDEIEGTIMQSIAWLSVGTIIGGLLVLMIVVNLVATVLRHYDFRLTLQRKALQITSGLLEKKNTIIRPEKVQFVSVSRNFFQKKLRFWEMTVMQASSQVGANHQGQHASHVEIPGCNTTERDQLLETLFGKDIQFTSVVAPNWRYVVRLFIVGLILPLGIYAGLVVWAEPEILEIWHFVVGYSVLFGIWAVFQYKNARLLEGPEFVGVQRGAWDVRRDILEPYKIQGVTLRQAIWHRRHNIGHLTLHTAAGDITFKYGPYALLQQLSDRLLFEAASTQKSWM